MQVNVTRLQEKVKVLEREVKEIKVEVKDISEDLDDLTTLKFKIENLQNDISTIKTTVTKDSGWRGFFLDFIKALAQIAVLVGAGKWIF